MPFQRPGDSEAGSGAGRTEIDAAAQAERRVGPGRFGQVRVDALVDAVVLGTPGLSPRIVGALRTVKSESLPAIVQRFQTTADAGARARLATVALHLGDADCARQMLAATKDPTPRTAFIVGFSRWHEDVPSLAAFLEDADADFRSGLLAAMALVPWDELNQDGREALHKAVAKLYTDAPDAATHSAAYCVLTNWKLPVPELKGTPGLPPERNWFVNGQGVTMIRIPAGTFVMGDDRGDYDDEKPAHQVRITRDFFLSDREVTRGLFERFVAETKDDANYPAQERVLDWTFIKRHKPRAGLPGARRQLARRRPVLQLAQSPGGTNGLLSAGQRRIGRRGLGMRSVVRRLSFADRSGMGVRVPRRNHDAVFEWRRSGLARRVRLAGDQLQLAVVASGPEAAQRMGSV